MKRYISADKHSIYAMSIFKHDAEKQISGQAGVINEHTGKLVLYGEDRPFDVNGWKKSICRSFSEVSSITLKPKGKKFSEESYVSMLLSMYGEDATDIRNFLSYIRAGLITGKDPYPDKDITPEMVEKCTDLVNLYIGFCKIISESKEEIKYEEFRSRLDAVI